MCEVGNLKTIKKSCGEANAPNLKTDVYVCFKEEVDVLPIPAAGTHEIIDPIEMRSASGVGVTPSYPAGGFVKLEVSKIDSSLVDEPQGDSENRYYNSTVKCFINKATSEKSASLHAMDGAEMIVVVRDGNGKQLVIGDMENGCVAKVKRQTSPKNGYEIEFMVENQPRTAPYYAGGITLRA